MRAFARGILHKHKNHKHHHHHHDHHHDERSPRMVFAHYMVGLTDGQTPEEWDEEMLTAHAAGIDGFALNIGPNDPWTLPQLRAAYEAAARLSSSSSTVPGHDDDDDDDDDGRPGFVLFLSFDMAAGEWSVQQVTDLVCEFRAAAAQCRVGGGGGRPLVSTFEGPGWAGHWEAVRRAVPGGLYLVPDWSSLGPGGVGGRLDVVDGAFSWAAWPRAGERRISAEEDGLYRRALRGKSYMMGVSPWFYTRLPQWDKNWHSSSETLWYDRWAQVLHEKPDFVQIITWNDYGESSYICDPRRPAQVVPGAELYVDGHSHSAFRAVLPYFIKAYKAGASMENYPPDQDRVIAWYRTTPAQCGSHGGTVWGQGGSDPASHGVRDVISVLAITREPTTVHLSIGDSSQELRKHHNSGHVSFYEVSMDGRTGPVTLTMHGKSAEGPAIRNECHPCGHVLFNCAAIEVVCD